MAHDQSGVSVSADVELKRLNRKADAELEDRRPPTPSTPEHASGQDDGGADSLDDDSSSDYINNTSEDEEDYDDGESAAILFYCNDFIKVIALLQ